jgi:drug/metabolite transporter (DMT)-like permease
MSSNLEPNLLATIPELAPQSLAPGSAIRLLRSWWLAFFASAVFVVSGHLLIKAGLNRLAVAANISGNGSGFSGLLQPELVGGLLVYCLGTVCWMRAVSLKEISFLYPLSSMNYVLVAAASGILFGEVISARRAVGIAIIVLGMVLMNRKSAEGAR